MKKLIFILSFIIFNSTLAQSIKDQDTLQNIKVGLVLSGGGAKGMAHIGVLKVIEEAGLQIDYIGGTSMGAIVGALYAAGYSAKQLDSIFTSQNYSSLLQDDIPRNSKTFFEKDDAEKYAITLPFDQFKVSFPKALSKGQNMYNLLSKLLNHVSNINDFNKLPIPFFCIATNIETGKETVLNKGYLPRAITASGAIPTLFSPVQVKDSIYVDGGITNNYPVERVKALGADFIIGVDVQDTLKTKEELQSALKVFMQISNYNTVKDMVTKLQQTNIYIHPNIKDYNIISFDDAKDIIQQGVLEGNKFKNQLKNIAKKQKKRNKTKITIPTNDSIFIKKVQIEGIQHYSRAYVLGKLKLNTPIKTSYKKFNEGVNNLSVTGNFQDINYRFIEDKEGATTIKFNLRESNSKMLLRIAAHYDDLYRTAALLNITRKRLLTNNDVASFDFIIGDNIRYNFNYYIDKGFYWSLGFNSFLNKFNKNVSVDFFTNNESDIIPSTRLNQIDLNYLELTNQFFVETLFKRSYLIRLGAEHKWLKYVSETIGLDENNNPRTLFDNTHYFSTYGTLRFDTYDNQLYPSKGFYFKGDFHYYLFQDGINTDFDQFSIAKTKIGVAASLFKNFSAVLSTEGGLKIGDGGSTNSFDFFMGGYGFKETNNLIPFYGFDALSHRGNTYLKSTLSFDYELYKNCHVNLSANIANIGNNLFLTKQWINGIDYTGYALGGGWETFLGPVELKYSYSPERKKGEWHVGVGFRF